MIEQRAAFSKSIDGTDGKSWVLPLPFDDPIQPLYKGPPLPLCVLEAAGIEPGADGTYEQCDKDIMARTCRQMAGWKLASNGNNVSIATSHPILFVPVHSIIGTFIQNHGLLFELLGLSLCRPWWSSRWKEP